MFTTIIRVRIKIIVFMIKKEKRVGNISVEYRRLISIGFKSIVVNVSIENVPVSM